MQESTITSKGQVTIPKEIRKSFGMNQGERIQFVEKNGELVIRPKIKDPVSKLRKLRKEIRFTEKQIDEMIKESKREWSKIE